MGGWLGGWVGGWVGGWLENCRVIPISAFNYVIVEVVAEIGNDNYRVQSRQNRALVLLEFLVVH